MIFNTLSIFATLALGAFSSAIPLSAGDVPAVSSISSALPAVPTPDISSLPVRRDQLTIVDIVKNTTTSVQTHVETLQFIQSTNATLETLGPIVDDIKNILADAIVAVEGLAGKEVNDIIGTVEGVVATVTVLAQVIAELLTTILTVVGSVLAVVTSDVYPCVAALLSSLVEVLGCLVLCIIMTLGSTVSGLLAALIPLLGGVLSIVSKLDVVVFVKVLGITV
ncbi:hypothetical protein B0H21DRAFT_581359 [Amylocystis lapponica]|nr:hypothetical protein B0H21DRAFT_581359 [Amylocystis lapponica]